MCSSVFLSPAQGLVLGRSDWVDGFRHRAPYWTRGGGSCSCRYFFVPPRVWAKSDAATDLTVLGVLGLLRSLAACEATLADVSFLFAISSFLLSWKVELMVTERAMSPLPEREQHLKLAHWRAVFL